MTEEHLDAPETTDSIPTTQLPDPEDSPFFRGGPTPDLQLPEEDLPVEQAPFATESRFRRERQEEQDAAVASLDETVLRPFMAPFDFESDEAGAVGGPPAPDAPMVPVAPHKVGWRRLGVAAVIAAIALAVGVRAIGSRQSNVGLFGLVKPAEQAAPQVAEPVVVTPVDVAVPEVEEEPVVEEAPAEEAPIEEEAPAEEYAEPETHTFTWDFSEPTTDGTSVADPEGYYSYTTPYDSWDDTDDGGTDRYNDNSSISLNFDGGNVTYYYDDSVVTMDWDVIDEIEQYLDSYDAWGYGGRDHARDRSYEPVYYYYGW